LRPELLTEVWDDEGTPRLRTLVVFLVPQTFHFALQVARAPFESSWLASHVYASVNHLQGDLRSVVVGSVVDWKGFGNVSATTSQGRANFTHLVVCKLQKNICWHPAGLSA
jgi:hypothetical protein